MKINFKQTVLIYFVCFCPVLYGQSTYKIQNSNEVDMKLSGTSTLHKWQMDARTAEGEAQFGFKAGSERDLVSLKALSFTLEVEDLKSDNKVLDKNAYKALKSDEFKGVYYKLSSATVSPEKDGKQLIRTQGKLTIAGVTKEIAMDVFSVINKDGSITCSGSYKLNMTDYEVHPPTFMLGAMKTGDAITLDFTMLYRK